MGDIKDILDESDYQELAQTSDPLFPVITLESALSETLSPIEWLLEPLIFKGSRSFIYADSGIGKSHFGLGMAAAIAAHGSFGPWSSKTGGRVLYIDGEMGFRDMQERLSRIATRGRFDIPGSTIRFITQDRCRDGVPPNIADPEVQRRLEHLCAWADLVIFDNWCQLAKSFERRQDEIDLWRSFSKWNVALTGRGKSTLLIHHTNKQGGFLGTNEMPQTMHVCMHLKRPQEYSHKDGARFELHFTKGRHLYGDSLEPQMCTFKSDDSVLYWDFEKLSDVLPRRIDELRALNMTERQICQELGISVAQLRRAASAETGTVEWQGSEEELF